MSAAIEIAYFMPPPLIDDESVPIATRIERLRVALERSLGSYLLMRLYLHYRENRDSAYPPYYLPSSKVKYVRLVLQLIEYEDELFYSN